jgi:hypothetical protein
MAEIAFSPAVNDSPAPSSKTLERTMATNPQFPQSRGPRRGPQRVDMQRLPLLKKSKAPWPLFAILAAVAILIALILWLPTTPKKAMPPTGAEVPQQPTGDQIQLTGLKITPAPVGSAMYLEGTLMNNGGTEVNGLQVEATFRDANGRVAGTQIKPVEVIVGGSDVAGENPVNAPIKPNDRRNFRVAFDNVPAAWNHQMPELKITMVTGTPANPPAS